MSGLTTAFVLIPCISASAVAVVLFDWRLAAAAACGALAFLFLAPHLPEVLRIYGSSVMSGVAICALALVALLLWRPSTSTWSRMSAALVATFTVTYGHLISLGVT
ncbi:hypothetical protein Q4555_06930 [Octadecabacter sp. 1_MG-2023]|uniref:hypothetical protein n=1 Tax=unclassified Octadecabacter TaxID=196158 RepID=UPI001C09ABAC|nr:MULTISPECIES: hypothetical protein [unclassified Octadecabacter]MBU2994315.1 hypothetical protein [Octadecabacter sp. B2R22]MDO6734396.1 hypothetical protein [Octadecabacter sp. 1_MG-2023]